jgi:hypothetical protein
MQDFIMPTHCKRGHEWTPENTGQQKTGRYCKTCRKLWHTQRKGEARVYHQAWSKANPIAIRANHLRSNYGLTLNQYQVMFDLQLGVCAICGEPERVTVKGKPRSLCVDHDHNCCPGKASCGKCVRGLICHTCNRWIGLAQDSPTLLGSAINYLDTYRKAA